MEHSLTDQMIEELISEIPISDIGDKENYLFLNDLLRKAYDKGFAEGKYCSFFSSLIF